MQSRTCAWVLSALSLLLLPVLPAVADEKPSNSKLALGPLKSRKLPESVKSALERGDYKAAHAAVLDELKQAESISFKDAPTVHLAMLHEWMRETSEEVLTRMAGESKEKRTFLTKFAQDAEWLELYLSCGLVPHQVDVGMNVLYRIWREEGIYPKN